MAAGRSTRCGAKARAVAQTIRRGPDSMHIEVVLTPAEIAALPARDLSATTCVVFDVLRATSTILTAFANGARRIYPAVTVEEARALRHTRFPDALLGGERGGVLVPGFDLGNSPLEYASAVVANREIITTTTNGTIALRACSAAREVLVGALLNLGALTEYLVRDHPSPPLHLLLVCAGTGKCFAFEDGLAAGALASRLKGSRDDAATAMQALFDRHGRDFEAAMYESANGRRLVEISLEADLAWCAQDATLDVVAYLRDGALDRVGGEGGLAGRTIR